MPKSKYAVRDISPKKRAQFIIEDQPPSRTKLEQAIQAAIEAAEADVRRCSFTLDERLQLEQRIAQLASALAPFALFYSKYASEWRAVVTGREHKQIDMRDCEVAKQVLENYPNTSVIKDLLTAIRECTGFFSVEGIEFENEAAMMVWKLRAMADLHKNVLEYMVRMDPKVRDRLQCESLPSNEMLEPSSDSSSTPGQ